MPSVAKDWHRDQPEVAPPPARRLSLVPFLQQDLLSLVCVIAVVLHSVENWKIESSITQYK